MQKVWEKSLSPQNTATILMICSPVFHKCFIKHGIKMSVDILKKKKTSVVWCAFAMKRQDIDRWGFSIVSSFEGVFVEQGCSVSPLVQRGLSFRLNKMEHPWISPPLNLILLDSLRSSCRKPLQILNPLFHRRYADCEDAPGQEEAQRSRLGKSPEIKLPMMVTLSEGVFTPATLVWSDQPPRVFPSWFISWRWENPKANSWSLVRLSCGF